MMIALRGIDGTLERRLKEAPLSVPKTSINHLLGLGAERMAARPNALFLFRSAEWPALDPKGAGPAIMDGFRFSRCIGGRRGPTFTSPANTSPGERAMRQFLLEGRNDERIT